MERSLADTEKSVAGCWRGICLRRGVWRMWMRSPVETESRLLEVERNLQDIDEQSLVEMLRSLQEVDKQSLVEVLRSL